MIGPRPVSVVSGALAVAGMAAGAPAQETGGHDRYAPGPAPVPRLFAPGTVSTGAYELNAVFEPDMRTVYFTRTNPRFPFPNSHSTILRSRWSGGRWSEPEVVPFSGVYSDMDPFPTADGEALLFMSNRPLDGVGPPRSDFDIWSVERAGGGWGTPSRLPPPVSTGAWEGHPTRAASGALYFFSARRGSRGGVDIYRSEPAGEGWAEPESLGPRIDGDSLDTNVWVSPDESYVVFSSIRPGGSGGMDLYVSFRGEDGGWGAPIGLGPEVNTPGWEFTPSVSPGGRYLFFARDGVPPDDRWRTERTGSPDALGRRIDAPGNGLGDVWFVELSALGIEGFP